jgi:hypothetical protein
VAAAAQAGLTVLATWQALRGQSVVAPDTTTVTVAVALLLLTVCGLVAVLVADRRAVSPGAATSPSVLPPPSEERLGARMSARAAVYFALSGVGLVGTWFFNLRFMSGDDPGGYVSAWFANAASSSAAVDVIVSAAAACVFYVLEGRRIGMRRAWVLIPLTFALALAFTFPLFLALRERALARRPSTT